MEAHPIAAMIGQFIGGYGRVATKAAISVAVGIVVARAMGVSL